jgi:hypothetical protein
MRVTDHSPTGVSSAPTAVFALCFKNSGAPMDCVESTLRETPTDDLAILVKLVRIEEFEAPEAAVKALHFRPNIGHKTNPPPS